MTPRWPGAPAAWSDGDAGGAAELQTDVMRFVAILALCLVAIFALVQAVPLETPAAEAAPHAAAAPAAPVTARQAVQDALRADAAQPPVQRATQNAPAPVRTAATPAGTRTRAAPMAAAPVAERDAEPVAAATVEPVPGSADAAAEAGFTLRFESDAALTSLVAQREIGLYAVRSEEARRLHVADGRLEFWTASMPSTFHEMDPGTVPGDVAAALARSGHGADAVRWGVTLPPRLARDIDRRIAAGGSGNLVIAANGALRQE